MLAEHVRDLLKSVTAALREVSISCLVDQTLAMSTASADCVSRRPDDDTAVIRARRDAAVERLENRIDYERTDVLPYREQDLKLDRMRSLLYRLGDPQKSLGIVHLAGTKGKGSTAAMISEMLTASGHRTGLFTSPHFDCLEERLAVDGQAATAAELLTLLDLVWPAVEDMDTETDSGHSDLGRPTYFEITTALAALHFARRRVDAAVLEVGLGGRLDSTNVCDPLLSVITSISFDHTQQLGETLAAIAREKAGIIKPGVPVISGATEGEPSVVIQQIADRSNAPLRQLGRDFRFQYYPSQFDRASAARPSMDFFSKTPAGEHVTGGLELGLLGRHQASNAAVALATIEELRRQGWQISDRAVQEGLRVTSLPGRIEVIARHPTIVIDTAHNVASAEALIATLQESFPASNRTLVLATTRDKDLHGILRVLAPHFNQLVITCYENNPRAMPIDGLDAIAAQVTNVPRRAFDQPSAVWDYLRGNTSKKDLICVTGSFFIAAEMRRIVVGRNER